MKIKYKFMSASDVIRDGLGVELEGEDGNTLAEVFRCDQNKTLIVSTFGNDIAFDALEELMIWAKTYLEPFEDGSPLSAAINFGAFQKR